MLHLKVYLRFHFKKHRNLQKKKTVKKKMHLTSLDGAVKGAPLNLKCGSICVLYILCNAEQTELLTFSNYGSSEKYVCG